jgi:hypothetical protein
MSTPTQRVVERIRELLTGETGLAHSVAALRDRPESILLTPVARQVGGVQASADLQEQSRGQEYPSFQVYVARIRNKMTEKFRRFSGTVEVVTEVRVSRDRLEGLTEELQFFADAVTDVVERSRGSLGEGMTLSGEYEVVFEPVKKGGLHFQQTARVVCEVDLSRH